MSSVMNILFFLRSR